jgi:hypothetical protein
MAGHWRRKMGLYLCFVPDIMTEEELFLEHILLVCFELSILHLLCTATS